MKTSKDRVLSYIRRCPVNGAARSTISARTGVPYPSACRRVSELLAEGKVVEIPRQNEAAVLVAIDG